MQETWAPKLLEQKAKRLRKETGNEKLYAELVSLWSRKSQGNEPNKHALSQSTKQPLLKKLETSLKRPFILLFTQPIIIALALYMAYL